MFLIETLHVLHSGHLYAALAPNVQVAQILNGFFMGLFWMFNGVYNPANSVPAGWRWYDHPLAPAWVGESGVRLLWARSSWRKAPHSRVDWVFSS